MVIDSLVVDGFRQTEHWGIVVHQEVGGTVMDNAVLILNSEPKLTCSMVLVKASSISMCPAVFALLVSIFSLFLD